MRIDEILTEDEPILWEHKGQSAQLPKSQLLSDSTHGIIKASFLTAAVLLVTLLITASFAIAFLLSAAILIPSALISRHFSKMDLNKHPVRYCMTKNGIYVQTDRSFDIETDYISFAKIEKVYREETGNSIVIQYVNHLVDGKMNDSVILENVPDPDAVVQNIKAQLDLWRQEDEMLEQTKQELSDAEKFRAPTPMQVIQISHPLKKRADSLREAGLKQGEQMQKLLPKKSRRAQWTPKATLTQTGDADAAFFGGIQGVIPVPGKNASFLTPDDTKEEVLASLSDETVSDLQAELFGTNAEQQGAFSDLTVNPLPVLPEADPALRAWDEINAQTKEKNDQNGQLMQ